MDLLEEKLRSIPRRPGVYLMKDGKGRVLYVGKAIRLDQRVRSYFGAGGAEHPKSAALVARIRDVETIVTDGEVEALLLEMTLIKEKRPPYNIRLRDDKRFPYLKITLGEDFPKAIVTRRTPRDGSRYFGPYTDVGTLRRTLKMMRGIFPIRSCMGARPGRGPRYRECLDFHIGRCAAPCIDRVDRDEYRAAVERLCEFLGGHGDAVIESLRREMHEASEATQFERAARLRDRIHGVERLLRRQKMLAADERDLDVFAFSRDEDAAYGVVLQVRGGTVLGKERRVLRGISGAQDADVAAAFLTQYYRDADSVPGAIALGVEPSDFALIGDWLRDRADRAVSVSVPRRGRIAGLVRLAEENARLDLEQARGESGSRGVAPEVYALQKALDLEAPPIHIEGFDVSNIQGTNPVASVVVFRAGRPARGAYRRFTVKRVEGANDFAMMAEVVGRRAARIVAGEFPMPDLLLIDGGAGQVGAARIALEQEGLAGVPVVGLAKREELLVLPGRSEPLRLARTDEGLRLLMRVRDEAHRFAVRFHRARRARAALDSRLDAIPGVGRSRKLLLLNAFGSPEGVAEAGEGDLAAVPGIGAKTARVIHRALHPVPAGEPT